MDWIIEWVMENWNYILDGVWVYFEELRYSFNFNFSFMMIALLVFIVGSFLNGVHQAIPDFIKRRYLSPSMYLAWVALALCVAGFYKINIESGNLVSLDEISNGNIHSEVAVIVGLVPSAIHWLYQFGVLKGIVWRNLAIFAVGCDFIFSFWGVSISWDLTTDSALSALVFSAAIVALCAVIGEMYVVDYLNQEFEKMQKRLAK